MDNNTLCSTVFDATLSACTPTIKVIGNLEATTNYHLYIETIFNKIYSIEVVTDANGSFTFDTIFLPKSFLIPQSGNFILWLSKVNAGCKTSEMKFCIDGVLAPFNKVVLSFIDSNILINEVGCVC